MPSHRLQRDPLGGELRQLGAGALERVRPWEEPISATERLFYLGLLYSGFGVIGEFRGQTLFIPTDLLDLLPPVERSPVRFELAPLEGVPPGVREGSLPMIEDAFVVLSDLQRRTVHAVKGRYLPPEALHRINERLTTPEAELSLRQRAGHAAPRAADAPAARAEPGRGDARGAAEAGHAAGTQVAATVARAPPALATTCLGR